MYRENRALVGGPCLCQSQAWGTGPARPCKAMWDSGQGLFRVLGESDGSSLTLLLLVFFLEQGLCVLAHLSALLGSPSDRM